MNHDWGEPKFLQPPLVIADTTVWVNYFRGIRDPQTEWLDREMTGSRLAILDLILCEVLQGIPDPKEFERTRRQLLQLEVFTCGEEDTAVESARNYLNLKHRGITIRKTIDCLIATYCISHGHSLLHNDRDFDPFETFLGLNVLHPPKHFIQ